MSDDISIVIPALNEETYLPGLLSSIDEQSLQPREVIVADGGSTDDTHRIAQEWGATVVSEPSGGPGRGRNVGAAAASGEVLLFLDADTELSHPHVLQQVSNALQEPDVVGGTATFTALDGGRIASFLSNAVSAGFFMLSLVGVSAAMGFFMFVYRDVFQSVGGFDDELPYCEDHCFMRDIRDRGATRLLPQACDVSVRRMQDRGVIGTLRDYAFPTFYYLLGSRELLKHRYQFEPGETGGGHRSAATTSV